MQLYRRTRKRKRRGAVDCVEDVWLAVQRRRPGVPRRSFGISLTPPLIISLFLCGLAGFVAGSGMHLTSRESGLRIPPASTPDTVYARDRARARVKCVRSISFLNRLSGVTIRPDSQTHRLFDYLVQLVSSTIIPSFDLPLNMPFFDSSIARRSCHRSTFRRIFRRTYSDRILIRNINGRKGALRFW